MTYQASGTGLTTVTNLSDDERTDDVGRGDRLSGLVGRSAELATLRQRIDATAAGSGGFIAIGGEPGIGKTRLSEAASAEARGRGVAVYVGRCYEGEWARPYGPWVEILADCARDFDRERLTRDLRAVGPAAAVLAGLVPVFAPLVDAPPPAALAPEQERFRLHDVVARCLLSAAEQTPLLLIFEDLHWADRPSLILLEQFARALGRSAVLVLGTYRDAALDRDHPLADALAALRREVGFVAVPLKGLGQAEVGELADQTAGRDLDNQLVRAIHEETGGNPFYTREMVLHLRDEGALDDDPALGANAHERVIGVPEGVRQVVGRRLGRLTEPTRRLLEHAAVFTGSVDFATVRDLVGLDEETLLTSLDEAIGAGFLRAVPSGWETYEFAHAIVRHALADDRNPSRIARLHRRAAEALERAHPGQEDDYAAELAIQYHRSAGLPNAAKGVPYALSAAERARAAAAHDEAVAMLRIARDLATGLDAGNRGTILCRLATAEAEALQLDEAERTTREALRTLEAADAPPARIAGFLAGLALALKVGGASAGTWRPLVARGLDLVGNERGLTWARLELLRDPIEPIPSDLLRAGTWRGFDPRAIEVARRLGDEEDHARTLESFDARSREETDALIGLARTWTRPTAVLWALTVAANDLQYRHGAFRDALALWRELQATAERHGAPFWQAQALHQQTLLHLALGDLAAAREAKARADELDARLGPGATARAGTDVAETAAAFALVLDGDWAGVAVTLTRAATERATSTEDVGSLAGLLWAALAALAHARAGATSAARRLLAALIPTLAHADPSGANQNGVVAFAAEAVWLLEAADLAASQRRWVLDVTAAGFGDYPQTSLALSAARMAVLVGNDAQATTHFARARAELEASGQAPLRAIVDYDEATALLRAERPDTARINSLLGQARDAFLALGMDGWLRRTETALDHAAAASRGRGTYPGGLTERETDVLRLVARGYSDRQIGDALFVSPRTINTHVRNMLAKAAVANRTELSVWAVEQGVVTPQSATSS